MRKLAFYDIEVTKYDALVVFKDINHVEIGHFWNNRDRRTMDDATGFEGVEDIVKGYTLCGFNNYHYDDFIITCMISQPWSQMDFIKSINDAIIQKGEAPIRVNDAIKSIDTMQQISVNHPSLKQIEGNMGKSIIESSIDFNVDHPLSDEERDIMYRYCSYDVDSTVEVYKQREKSYFETKTALLNMMPDDMREKAARWNTTTLSANILLGNEKLTPWTKHRVPDKYWRNVEGIPPEVWDMWEKATESDHVMDKGFSKKIHAFGCDIVFGMGGLHGAPSRPGVYYDVLLADVGSMYPSLIIMLNALNDATKAYADLRNERLKIKHVDKVKSDALKLVLNSVYGNFKNKYSSLFNPLASATVCIYGQIALFTLCRELHNAGYEIVNINTDGVGFVYDARLKDAYKDIITAWEDEFKGMVLEVSEFDKWIQKDVNNYIATVGDKIKTKGGETNKYAAEHYFDNNNARIVHIALVEYLVKGVPITNTLIKYIDDPSVWMFILKAGKTFKGVQDRSGEWQQNVNRVFAVNESCTESTKLYKIRADDGQVNFPDAPERMYICNGDISHIPDFASIVDYDFYKSLVESKLKGWPYVHRI